MSSTKLNPTRALVVITSDNCNVPSPNLLATGTATGAGTNLLIDANAYFIVNPDNGEVKVNTGDVVYCYETGLAATIVEVIDKTTLLLNADGVVDAGNKYFIYQEGPTTGQGNQGCLLYIGSGASTSLHITTIGGDEMEIAKAGLGLFVIQTKKVWSSGTAFGAGEIFALW